MKTDEKFDKISRHSCMLIRKLENTILVKAGDDKVKLGYWSRPPKVDCRIIAEELYQEILSALEKPIDQQESNVKEFKKNNK